MEEKLEHVHNYEGAYKSDKDYHWKECACGEKSSKTKHIDANNDSKCDECMANMKVEQQSNSCASSSAHLVVTLLSSLSLLAFVIIKKRN